MNKIFAVLLAFFLSTNSWAAMDFDGTDDRIDIPSTTPLQQIGKGDFTISFWLKMISTPTQFDAVVSSYIGTLNYIIISFRSGTTNLNIIGGGANLDAPTAISLGTWQFYAFGRRGSTVFISVNGTETTQGGIIGGMDSDHSFTIMNDFAGGFGDRCPNGTLDDLRFYNRGLSSSELESLAKSRSRLIITEGLSGWYKLDDGNDGATASGATVYDSSGNGNTGTPANSPVWRASTFVNYP